MTTEATESARRDFTRGLLRKASVTSEDAVLRNPHEKSLSEAIFYCGKSLTMLTVIYEQFDRPDHPQYHRGNYQGQHTGYHEQVGEQELETRVFQT